MILPVHEQLRERLRQTLDTTFSLPPADQPAIVIETPPTRALGDLAVPVAFELARRLRKAPKRDRAGTGRRAGIDRRRRARRGGANGYLNFFLDRARFPRRAGCWTSGREPPHAGGKVIVEHTAINPNKAAHIGHLRNATLGDTLVRAAALPGPAGRGAELHRRHRRAGRRRRRRLHDARTARSRRPSRRWPTTGTAIRLLLLGPLRARHRVVRGRQGAPRARAPTRCTRSKRAATTGRDGRVHRRPHRPLPPRDDGADERRLRPAHVGRRHPAPALLGDGVRAAQGPRRGVPADRGPAEGLLGHADRGCDAPAMPPPDERGRSTTTPNSARRSSSGRTAR